MENNGIVNIHGKDYMTVAKRVELAHQSNTLESVETEVVSHNPVVIRAKVTIDGRTFTGISAVNVESGKMIERQSPYEVAETSAVGRALGFAGYGVLGSIASADELAKVSVPQEIKLPDRLQITYCEKCGEPARERSGISKAGRKYRGIFCSTENKSHTKWLFD